MRHRSIEEERDGGIALGRVRRILEIGRWDPERVHAVQPLSLQAQRLAAGRQNRQRGTALEKLGGQRRAVEQVLEIVQHQEQLPICEEAQER